MIEIQLDKGMNVQHKAAILIYVRFSLVQRPYAILILYCISYAIALRAIAHKMHSIA